ncbi:MAG: hypothetical protein H0T09_07080 [Actinobacteria bacterium]|nr:hypothetical protein [Actinomycetota bacterium]
MPDERIRLEIAFDAGQGMAVLVPPSTADELEQALATSLEGTFAFEAEDGSYTIALRRVVFVKRFSRESRVGFLNS